MTCDVHKRFASAFFPSEMRLQVMKAGIPYSTTYEFTRKMSFETEKDLMDEIHDLLLSSRQQKHSYERDPWADGESAGVIMRRAEEAFFEKVIFKLGIESTLPTSYYYHINENFLSSLPKVIGSQARHLDTVTVMQAFSGPSGEQHPLNVTHFRKMVKYVETIKLYFANLKACILTIDVRIQSLDVFRPHTYKPFDQKFLLWAARTNEDIIGPTGNTMATEVASLFDALVAKGPGRSQFVRMRYVCPSQPLQEHGGKLYEPFSYGPLVKVDCEKMTTESPDESFGTQLVRNAHQLTRAGPWSTAEEQ